MIENMTNYEKLENYFMWKNEKYTLLYSKNKKAPESKF